MSKYMTLVQVNNACYFLDIPEADLRILCGTPADCVKQLLQLRIIRPTEKDGVSFETGPNAILLSDTAIQNGQICNASEFPVLQMLYRQGMALPNHPNNTNVRPVLIGAARQIKSQMDYIYLGNYGIDSLTEIIDAGLTPEEAKELISLKKYFAFGNFKPTSELLESCEVRDQKTHIRNGVYIFRLSANVFEFSYKDQTVRVDINLPKKQNYGNTYSLGFYNLQRSYFSVVHSGQGDGWDIHRPSMSSILFHQGKVYLIDAGPNIKNILNAVGIGINEIVGIFQTHIHDDHFSGITSLMGLDHRLNFYTTQLIRHSALKKLSALLSIDEDVFSNFFNFIDLHPDEWNAIHDLEVKPFYSPHPIETVNFYFRCMSKCGYKTYAHLADTTSFRVLDGMVNDNPDQPGISRIMNERVRENYLTPADVKKVDVGGGMIHGEAVDYRSDKSAKIVFAHTSSPIEDNERLIIGSEAHFGAVDELIDTRYNYLMDGAKNMIQSYFDSVHPDNLLHLLNQPITSFHPKTIIYKEGQQIEYVYLVLTGNVIGIFGDSDDSIIFQAGNFIGEEYIYDARQAKLTYRTGSYVNVLSIPIAVIDNLVSKYKIRDTLNINQKYRLLLQKSSLFGYHLSGYKLNFIIKNINIFNFSEKDGSYEKFELMIKEYMEKNNIFIIISGRIQLKIGPHDALITLDSGDFFGENIIHDFKPLTHFYPEGDCEICVIPYKLLKDIPVIFQQLNEQYQKIYITVAGFLQKHEASAHFSPAVYTQPAQMMSSGGYVLYHLYQLAEYLYSVGDRVLLIRVLYNLSRYYKKYTERVRIRMMRYRSSESHTLMNAHDKITVSLDNLYKGIADGRFGDEDLQSLRKNIIICIDQINHNPVM